MFLMYPVIFNLVALLHIVSFIVVVILGPLTLLLSGFFFYLAVKEAEVGFSALLSNPPNYAMLRISLQKMSKYFLTSASIGALYFAIQPIKKYFKNFKLPNYTLPMLPNLVNPMVRIHKNHNLN